MTQENKIIRAKVGLLELARQLGKCQPSLQNDGLQPRQLLPLQGALATPSAGELALQEPHASQADLEEPARRPLWRRSL